VYENKGKFSNKTGGNTNGMPVFRLVRRRSGIEKRSIAEKLSRAENGFAPRRYVYDGNAAG
jgi:hypothetical protein